MTGERILIVEDEQDILELIKYNLQKDGFITACVSSGEDGLKQTKSFKPDLVILDLMLPGVDGLQVCRQLKSEDNTAKIPVIMVTARGEEADIVAGLEMGADDYITKPFSPKVLIARVKGVLRRKSSPPEPTSDALIRVDELEIDVGRHIVTLSGQKLELTFSEFKILQKLVTNRGWVFTRKQLVDAVHGINYPVTDRAIDVQIVGLRKKLDTFGARIETIRGVGYRFQSEGA
jgi:two-component system alkaline phosphatase synthesis response regulator PhoP